MPKLEAETPLVTKINNGLNAIKYKAFSKVTVREKKVDDDKLASLKSEKHNLVKRGIEYENSLSLIKRKSSKLQTE